MRTLLATAAGVLGGVSRRWRRIVKSMGLVLLGMDVAPGPTFHLWLPNVAGGGDVRRPPNPAKGLHLRVVPPTVAMGTDTPRRGIVLGSVRVVL